MFMNNKCDFKDVSKNVIDRMFPKEQYVSGKRFVHISRGIYRCEDDFVLNGAELYQLLKKTLFLVFGIIEDIITDTNRIILAHSIFYGGNYYNDDSMSFPFIKDTLHDNPKLKQAFSKYSSEEMSRFSIRRSENTSYPVRPYAYNGTSGGTMRFKYDGGLDENGVKQCILVNGCLGELCEEGIYCFRGKVDIGQYAENSKEELAEEMFKPEAYKTYMDFKKARNSKASLSNFPHWWE